MPPTEPTPTPVEYEQVERRTFGLAPQSLIAALAALALGAAVALFTTRNIVAALLLLAAALLLGAFYVEQARRRRRTPVDRLTAAVVDNSHALAGFAGTSLRVWTSAGRTAARLQFEARTLARERARLLAALGTAAYDRDDELVEDLRRRIDGVDARREACTVERLDAVETARARTAEERLAVGATEVRTPDEVLGHRAATAAAGELDPGRPREPVLPETDAADPAGAGAV